MFAAIIRSGHDFMPLAATLGSLVEGAAAGLIGHAVVIAPVAAAGQATVSNEMSRLIEATGADSVIATDDAEADWRKAAPLARGDWLVMINAGEVFNQGWIAAIERHAMTSSGRPGLIPLAGWRGHAEFWQAQLAPHKARAGCVASKAMLLSGFISQASTHQASMHPKGAKILKLAIRRERLG